MIIKFKIRILYNDLWDNNDHRNVRIIAFNHKDDETCATIQESFAFGSCPKNSGP